MKNYIIAIVSLGPNKKKKKEKDDRKVNNLDRPRREIELKFLKKRKKIKRQDKLKGNQGG